jgi:hypothetical protein
MYRNMEMVLNFDWTVVIENEKNHTFDFNIVFWLYAINQKIFNFNMIILYLYI